MKGRLVSEPEGYELLKGAGIAVPAHGVAHSPDEAAALAESIGFPVVLKVISSHIVHKSDAGGVKVGISSPAGAREAYAAILAGAAAYDSAAVVSGVLVVRQQAKGLEIIVGGRIDPTFGRIITVGMGGTLVELLRDVSIRVLPVQRDDIHAMISELQGSRLIDGYRNEPARDRQDRKSVV